MTHRASGGHPESSDPLVDASWVGRADLVEALLSRGADPNGRDERGTSPLGAATRRGHLGAMRALLAAEADPNEADAAGIKGTPLQLSAGPGGLEPMRLLLSAGAEPNRREDDGRTVLMSVVWPWFNDSVEDRAERAAMTRLLIAAGADVNAVSDRGWTALGNSGGEDEIVRILLEAGAEVRPHGSGEVPLLVRVLWHRRPSPSREAGFHRLIAAGAEVNAADPRGETPLKWACAHGARRIVGALLEAGARRVGATGDWRRPTRDAPELHLAAGSGDPLIIRMLLHDGADLNELDQNGRAPIQWAAVRGRAEAVRALLAAGADPNAGREQGRSALRAAAIDDHAECVELLLKAGADVDGRTADGATALHLASLAYRLRAIPPLVDAGADPNAPDAKGQTPLMWALRAKTRGKTGPRKVRETVDLLLDAGADPFAVDHRGRTALFLAARSAALGEIKRLLALGLDVNGADRDGLTPLMMAVGAWEPEPRAVEAILAAGADVNAVDRGGASALHHLLRPLEPRDSDTRLWSPSRSWSSVLLELLLKAGADANRADGQGLPPLMLASRHQREDLASMLLQAGADPNARDQAGRTASDHAKAAGRDHP